MGNLIYPAEKSDNRNSLLKVNFIGNFLLVCHWRAYLAQHLATELTLENF